MRAAPVSGLVSSDAEGRLLAEMGPCRLPSIASGSGAPGGKVACSTSSGVMGFAGAEGCCAATEPVGVKSEATEIAAAPVPAIGRQR